MRSLAAGGATTELPLLEEAIAAAPGDAASAHASRAPGSSEGSSIVPGRTPRPHRNSSSWRRRAPHAAMPRAKSRCSPTRGGWRRMTWGSSSAWYAHAPTAATTRRRARTWRRRRCVRRGAVHDGRGSARPRRAARCSGRVCSRAARARAAPDRCPHRAGAWCSGNRNWRWCPIESAADAQLARGDTFGAIDAYRSSRRRSQRTSRPADASWTSVATQGSSRRRRDAQGRLAEAHLAEGHAAEARVIAEDLLARSRRTHSTRTGSAARSSPSASRTWTRDRRALEYRQCARVRGIPPRPRPDAGRPRGGAAAAAGSNLQGADATVCGGNAGAETPEGRRAPGDSGESFRSFHDDITRQALMTRRGAALQDWRWHTKKPACQPRRSRN